MDCNLTDEARKKGIRCRTWNCQGCRNFNNEGEKMETQNNAFDRILKYFKFEHLPQHLQEVSKDFSELAHQMATRGYDNVPETMAGLRKLLEAKDCAVRACIK